MTTIPLTNLMDAAHHLAEQHLVRVEPNLFAQYLHYKLGGVKPKTATITRPTLRSWVTTYDLVFNHRRRKPRKALPD